MLASDPETRTSASMLTRTWITITVVGLLGLYITIWIDESTKGAFPPGEGARPAEWAGIPFFALYLIGTHLLAPWDIVVRRKAREPSDIETGRMVVYPWWSWLFLGPLISGDERAKFPTPIAAIGIWFLCVLCAWLLMLLGIVGLNGVIHHKA
jgi:hypothetical protein